MPSLRCTCQLKCLVLNCYLRRVLFRFSFSQISTHFYLRNRKHFMCFRKVVQTSVWVSEKSYWEHGDFSWNLEKTRTHGFFKGHKLHSSFVLVLSWGLWKNSLVRVFSNLHSKSCYYQHKFELHILFIGWKHRKRFLQIMYVVVLIRVSFVWLFWRLCDAVTFQKLIGN